MHKLKRKRKHRYSYVNGTFQMNTTLPGYVRPPFYNIITDFSLLYTFTSSRK